MYLRNLSDIEHAILLKSLARYIERPDDDDKKHVAEMNALFDKLAKAAIK